MKKFDLILIAQDEPTIERCTSIAKDFNFSFAQWPTLDAFFDLPEQPVATLILLSTIDAKSKEEAAGQVQTTKQMCQDAWITCIVGKTLDGESSAFIKKSGANVILLEDEVFNTSKVEFICSQVLKSSYLPIKPSELSPNVPVDFNVYHLMPLRGKFLTCAHASTVLTKEKIEKISSASELYIKKDDAEKFKLYTAKYTDKTAAGLAMRCRAQYLSLYATYIDLVFLLTDRSEAASFRQGQDLLSKCRELSAELGASLGALGSAWEIINNSAIGEFGSVERSPAVASYSALFALQSDMDNIDQIMVAALLADLSLITMPPALSKKIREDRMEDFSQHEKELYQKHPALSLNIVLERKLPLDEKMRNLILTTHESNDGSGFPNGVLGHKIPKGAQVIQLSEKMDKLTVIRMGKARAEGSQVRKDFIASQITVGKFPIDLLVKLRDAV